MNFMPRTMQRQGPGATAKVASPLRKELVYTKSGRVGFLQSETAYTVTIQFGPDAALTLSKDDVDHRVRLI